MRSETAAWSPDAATRPGSARACDSAAREDGSKTSAASAAATRRFRFGISARPVTEPALSAGVMIGDRYRVEALVGEGGMGRVYRARHVFLDRPVALKVLRRDARSDPDSIARFQREALAASRVGHPSIVGVTDFAKLPDGQVFLAMELLEGESLEAWIERPNRLGPGLAIIAEIADGLHAAHAAGVIHRDVKPANILLTEAGAKIVDFGIAKMATEHAGGYTTNTGAVLGTPYYLAPERARGEEPEQRADVYSLGVILYEMLTGRLPFVADSFMAILGHHMRTAPLDPRAAVPGRDVPDALADLCMRMLAKNPRERPFADEVARSCRQLRQAMPELDELAAGARSGVAAADDDTVTLSVEAVDAAPRPTESDAETRGGRPWVVAVVVALVVGVAAGLATLELSGGLDLRRGAVEQPAVAPSPAPSAAPEGATTVMGAPARSGPAAPAEPTPGPAPKPTPPTTEPETEPEHPQANDPRPAADAPTDAHQPRRRREREPRAPAPIEPAETPAAAPTDAPTPGAASPPELKDDIYGDD